MILVNIDYIPNQEIELLGMVKGSMIQTKHMFRDMFEGLKGLVGGELKGYTEMMNEARQISTKRMVDEAEALGADAIICVRYASASIAAGAAEVFAYGTAVKFVNTKQVLN